MKSDSSEEPTIQEVEMKEEAKDEELELEMEDGEGD